MHIPSYIGNLLAGEYCPYRIESRQRRRRLYDYVIVIIVINAVSMLNPYFTLLLLLYFCVGIMF